MVRVLIVFQPFFQALFALTLEWEVQQLIVLKKNVFMVFANDGKEDLIAVGLPQWGFGRERGWLSSTDNKPKWGWKPKGGVSVDGTLLKGRAILGSTNL